MEQEGHISEREQLILQAVVHTYITTAEAVGSRTIVKRYNLDLSPATVRNAMADLEEMGYLEQIHTSSGRVPTSRGYRYYVNYLMRVQDLTLAERSRIEMDLSRQLNDVDEIMRRASQLLALTSHQMGFVETPAVRDACVRSIEVMPVAPARFAFLIADSLGRIHTAMTNLGEPLIESDLSKLRAFLNETLRGVSLDRVHETVADRVALMHDENRRIGERALTLAGSTEAVIPGRLYMEGATQLFEQPEFQEHGRAKEVFSLLDEREKLMELLRASMRQGRIQSSVLIGEEVAGPGMRELSVVASPYYAGDKPIGAIGILGPKRMPYNRLTALVDYTAGLLSRLMTRLAG